MLVCVCAEEQLDVPYQEVKDVVFIGRGIGAWGDMVITLKNSDKIEMRSLPRYSTSSPLSCNVTQHKWTTP